MQHTLGYVIPVYSSMPLVPTKLAPQQLMSLKTLRPVIALITIHSCLPPAAALTAAVPVIDGIL